jgi:hypothetical protein
MPELSGLRLSHLNLVTYFGKPSQETWGDPCLGVGDFSHSDSVRVGVKLNIFSVLFWAVILQYLHSNED